MSEQFFQCFSCCSLSPQCLLRAVFIQGTATQIRSIKAQPSFMGLGDTAQEEHTWKRYDKVHSRPREQKFHMPSQNVYILVFKKVLCFRYIMQFLIKDFGLLLACHSITSLVHQNWNFKIFNFYFAVLYHADESRTSVVGRKYEVRSNEHKNCVLGREHDT